MTTLRISTDTRECEYVRVPTEDVRDIAREYRRHGATVKIVN